MVRDNVVAVSLPGDGSVPRLARVVVRRSSTSSAGPIAVRMVPSAALREAMRLAGGDLSRLTFDADGAVIVENDARAAYRGEHP